MSAGSFYFDPNANGIEVFLGPTEAQLMELAWRHESLTVKRAQLFMGGESKKAYTTIMTVLARLAGKGYLVRVKDGRSYIYRAAVDRKTFISERIRDVRHCLDRQFPEA